MGYSFLEQEFAVQERASLAKLANGALFFLRTKELRGSWRSFKLLSKKAGDATITRQS